MPKSILQINRELPQTTTDLEQLAVIRQRLAGNVAKLREFRDAPSMTNAQLLGAIKFLARNQLAMMRFMSRQFPEE